MRLSSSAGYNSGRCMAPTQSGAPNHACTRLINFAGDLLFGLHHRSGEHSDDLGEAENTISQNPDCLPRRVARALIGDERRHSPRLEADCSAVVTSGCDVVTTPVINISEGGLQIEAPAAVIGASIEVALPGLPIVQGRIGWVKNGRAGIVFNKPLGAETLRQWFLNYRVALRRAAGSFIGVLTSISTSPAAVAQAAQQSTVQTHASLEVVDFVGVVVRPVSSGSKPATLQTALAADGLNHPSVVSISAPAPTMGSRDSAQPAAEEALLYQFN
jgi:hypothetical protein